MPSALAFLICTIFVLFLLNIDRQCFKNQPITNWIPALWLLYCGSKPFPAWLQSSRAQNLESLTAAVIEGSASDRIFLLFLITAGLMILLKRKVDWKQIAKENRILLVLLLYTLISISWSQYPFVSFKRWAKFSGTFVMSLIILTGESPLKSLESLLKKSVYILIPFSMLLIKYFPHLGVQYGRWSGATMWAGATMGKNTLGLLCMFSVLFLVLVWAKNNTEKGQFVPKHEKMAHIILFFLCFWMLKGPGNAYSATSLVVLAIGLSTFFILRRFKTSENFSAIACTFLLIIGATFLIMRITSTNPLELVASVTGRDMTLTGRADFIWPKLIPIALKNPIFGKGYGGFWIQYMQADKFTINQAHNGYLDVFIELGLVGLVLLAILIVQFFKKATLDFAVEKNWSSFRISFLIVTLLHNITESSYLVSTAFLWNLLIMLMVVYKPKTRKI